MCRSRRSNMLFIPGLLLLALGGVEAAEPKPKSLAEEILASTGVKTGLCVQLGCRDAALMADLARGGKLLIHGLEPDDKTVSQTRSFLQGKGVYGPVSVERGKLSGLPYADNLVNLVIADDLPRLLAAGLSLKEVMRVLCPNGVAYLGAGTLKPDDLKAKIAAAGIKNVEIIQRAGVWAKVRKPRPAGMDEWSQTRHGVDGNAVSKDTLVGPPTQLRWLDGPLWPRTWDNMGPAVSAGGRNFYLTNLANPPKEEMILFARDAYNGLPLWQRPLKGLSRGESFPMFADKGRLYLVLERNGPLTALDAANGEIVHAYQIEKETTSPIVALLHSNHMLLAWSRALYRVDMAGKTLWKYNASGSLRGPHLNWGNVLIGDGQVFFTTFRRIEDGSTAHQLVCLDWETGKERWWKSTTPWGNRPTLTSYRAGVLAFGEQKKEGGVVHTVSAKDGSHLWSYTYPLIGHGGSPWKNNFFIGGLLWINSAGKPYAWLGLDPDNGSVKKRIEYPEREGHRCYADTATERFLIGQSNHIFDWEKEKSVGVRTQRGSCRIGYLPANGLLYTFPHACQCYPMLNGFLAFASTPAVKPPSGDRLELISRDRKEAPPPADTDWPTYRHDVQRSGSTTATLPAELKPLWKTQVGAGLTSPVIAAGTVFVGSKSDHRVTALDAQTGKIRWSFTADGPLESPPTIYQGLCLFGASDGRVYCLRADNGHLLWRFRAAPVEQRILVHGRLESPWPVLNIFVIDGVACFTSGRHSQLDGGVTLFGVEPATGKLLWEKRLPQEKTGVLNDLLVSDGKAIFLRNLAFDCKNGEKPQRSTNDYLRGGVLGLLYDSTGQTQARVYIDRAYWSRAGHGRDGSRGHILVLADDRTFGYVGRDDKGKIVAGDAAPKEYEIFACRVDKQGLPIKNGPGWSVRLPVHQQVTALLLAGDKLFAAGIADTRQSPASAKVWSFSAADGKPLATSNLDAAPVFDGLAATEGKLFVAGRDGTVMCLGK